MLFNKSNLLAAVDIGSSKVCTLICESDRERITIRGLGLTPSEGIRKGVVVSRDLLRRKIQESVELAEAQAKFKISNVMVNLSGNHLYSFNNSGAAIIPSKSVGQEDIQRAQESAKAITIPEDREVIHHLLQRQEITSVMDIANPHLEIGKKCQSSLHIITALKNEVALLRELVTGLEMHTDELVINALACSESVLLEEEREQGVLVVDIGGGTTDLVLWHKNSVVYSQTLALGGDNFTQDLMAAFEINKAEAERVKQIYGNVLLENTQQYAHISLKKKSNDGHKEVAHTSIAKVLYLRAEELFGIIHQILKEKKCLDQFSTIVLTGGSAKLKSLNLLCEFVFNKKVRIGSIGSTPNTKIDGFSVYGPEFATVMGLILIAHHRQSDKSLQYYMGKKLLVDRFQQRLRELIREIF